MGQPNLLWWQLAALWLGGHRVLLLSHLAPGWVSQLWPGLLPAAVWTALTHTINCPKVSPVCHVLVRGTWCMATGQTFNQLISRESLMQQWSRAPPPCAVTHIACVLGQLWWSSLIAGFGPMHW